VGKSKRIDPRKRYRGQTYRSILECEVAKNLAARKIKKAYEPEVIAYKYSSEHTYTPDFKITREDKSKFFVEVKGRLRDRDIRTLTGMKQSHPDLDLKILFAQDNLMPGRKTVRYSDWAAKMGYECAFGTEIPEEWL
jgi:predicted nuclease of restriction endonuclease-like RecB superfamily